MSMPSSSKNEDQQATNNNPQAPDTVIPELPTEVLANIARMVDLSTLGSMEQVSKDFKLDVGTNRIWFDYLNYRFPYQADFFNLDVEYKTVFKETELRHYGLASAKSLLAPRLASLFKLARKRYLSKEKLKESEFDNYNEFFTQILNNLEQKDSAAHTLLSAIQQPKLLAEIYRHKTQLEQDIQKQLIWACRCNQIEEIRRLVSQGAFVYKSSEIITIIISNNGVRGLPVSVLSEAIKGLRLEVINTLLELEPENSQAMIADINFEAFRKAATYGHTGMVEKLLKEINSAQKQAMIAANDFEAFQYAARYGHTGVVEKLLTKVDDPQKMLGYMGFVAFWMAASKGHTKVVEKLLATQDKDLLTFVEKKEYRYDSEVQLLIDMALPEKNSTLYSSLVSIMFKGVVASALLIGATAMMTGIMLIVVNGALSATSLSLVVGGASSLALGVYGLFHYSKKATSSPNIVYEHQWDNQ